MTLFSDLGLSPELVQAVSDKGYVEPTPIQAQAIPAILIGRDILGCAQTGTGKTASFTLPMIDILAQGRTKARMPRSLILEPTRELAAQVAESFVQYGKNHNLSMALLIGGESMAEQEKKLDRGVDVLIATPGRLMDLFQRGRILLNDCKILVVDEADRMLDMGFIPDVEKIVSLLPQKRQTLFFSATMPPVIRKLADQFLSGPKEITVSPPATTSATITQWLVTVPMIKKREALRDIIRAQPVDQALIFCNRKRDVEVLYRSLTRHGFNAARLHGDMPQPKRTEILNSFRQGEITLLVCSDVAARGLDVPAVSHVFNFDVPIHPDDYVHRIGRTGRAGREGAAYSFAAPSEMKAVAAIEAIINQPIPRLPVPSVVPVQDASPVLNDLPIMEPAPSETAPSEPGAAAPSESPRPRRRPARPERKRRQDGTPPAEMMVDTAPDDQPMVTPAAPRSTSGEPNPALAFEDHIPAFILRPVAMRPAET